MLSTQSSAVVERFNQCYALLAISSIRDASLYQGGESTDLATHPSCRFVVGCSVPRVVVLSSVRQQDIHEEQS